MDDAPTKLSHSATAHVYDFFGKVGLLFNFLMLTNIF